MGTGRGGSTGDGDTWTVLVALANPGTERALVELGATLAQYHDGRVVAAHVVTVPDQTPLDAAAQHRDLIDPDAATLLADARADAAALDVPVETKTVLSHRGLAEVFDAARANDADALVLGYGGARLAGGRAEGTLDELTASLPCDVLVLDGAAFDPSEVLVATTGGTSADLSATVARVLREVADADVTLLYVADDGDTAAGRAFLADWAVDHGLAGVDSRVEAGEPGAVIARHGSDATLVVVGASGRGLLTRVVRGSPTSEVLADLETPVLMTERPAERSLRDRLFGRR